MVYKTSLGQQRLSFEFEYSRIAAEISQTCEWNESKLRSFLVIAIISID